MHAILGTKLGMTQIWGPEGNRFAATVVQVGPCVVTKLKREDGKDGYNAVQFGYEAVPERKLSKPEVGVFKKVGLAPHRHLREFRVTKDQLAQYEVGQTITTEHLKVGNFVDAVGVTKGRGFTGVMKRYQFQGFSMSHGVHESYRGPGTGGRGSLQPSRVPPGSRRPGQMGNCRATSQTLLIMAIDPANNLVFLNGAVPGPRNGVVLLQSAKKAPEI